MVEHLPRRSACQMPLTYIGCLIRMVDDVLGPALANRHLHRIQHWRGRRPNRGGDGSRRRRRSKARPAGFGAVGFGRGVNLARKDGDALRFGNPGSTGGNGVALTGRFIKSAAVVQARLGDVANAGARNRSRLHSPPPASQK